MQKKPVAAVINFCTNESRFLTATITEASRFASQILVSVSDHFFDGTVENLELLDQIYRSFPGCTFIQYPFIPQKIPRRLFKDISHEHFWHSVSRLVAAQFLSPSIESVLFIDADEVPDGRRFQSWLEDSDYRQHTALRLSNYWYFREPKYQATSWENSVLLVQRRSLENSLLLADRERDAIYDELPGPKRSHVTDANGEPMFHHFSWVRTREEMLKKVTSWGHKADRDWASLVEKEFLGPFSGRDFVHGYEFKTVSAPFEIDLGPVHFQPILERASFKKLDDSQLLSLLHETNPSIWRRIFRW